VREETSRFSGTAEYRDEYWNEGTDTPTPRSVFLPALTERHDSSIFCTRHRLASMSQQYSYYKHGSLL